MSIQVEYQPEAAVLGQAALQSGLGDLRTQASQIAQQELIRRQALEESQRQFDLSMAMRARSEYNQQRQQQASLNAQLASRQQSMMAQLAAQQAQQEYQTERDARLQAYGMQDMEFQNQLLYGRQQALSVEEEATQMFKDLRKLKLDPTGQNRLAEAAGAFRDIQSGNYRPEQRAEMIADLLEDVHNEDFEQYVPPEPNTFDGLTPMQGQEITDPKNLPWGFYERPGTPRNGQPGVPERVFVRPKNPIEWAEWRERNNVPDDIPGLVRWDVDNEGEIVMHEIPQPQLPKEVKAKSRSERYADAQALLIDRAPIDPKTGNPREVKHDDIIKQMDLMEEMDQEAEEEAEAGEGNSGPDAPSTEEAAPEGEPGQDLTDFEENRLNEILDEHGYDDIELTGRAFVITGLSEAQALEVGDVFVYGGQRYIRIKNNKSLRLP